MPHVSPGVAKAVAVGLVASVAAIAILSTFLRRRKRRSATAGSSQCAGPGALTTGQTDASDAPQLSSTTEINRRPRSQPGRGNESRGASVGGGSVPGQTRAPSSADRRQATDVVQSLSLCSTSASECCSTLSPPSTTATLVAAASIDEDALVATLTLEQVCQLGLETLRRTRSLWEEALARLQAESSDAGLLEPRLCALVQRTRLLEALYESGIDEQDAAVSVRPLSAANDREAQLRLPASAADDSTLADTLHDLERHNVLVAAVRQRRRGDRDEEQEEGEEVYDEAAEGSAKTDDQRRRSDSLASSASSCDSYVSALEVADLSDLEERVQAVRRRQSMRREGSGDDQAAVLGDEDAAAVHRQLLYEHGLLQVQQGSVPYRKLRTVVVGCSSDSEFLARLYAVRCGLDEMLKNDDNRLWLLGTGKSMIARVLERSARDPKDFESALHNLVDFVRLPENWEILKEELLGRNVKCYTFYDIVLDFILMDAFDDLANPPASVTSVTLNRWLSNGLKETALSTAVWSVLKAKRRMLKFPRGFIAHFYSLSEQVSPALAWGFLGPDSELKEVCFAFKDQVMGFISDLFNPNKVRYTTLEEMAADMMATARRRSAIVMSVLHNGDVCPV